MMKFMFVIYATVALMQQTQAFKVVTIQKVLPPPPAIDAAAVLQGVQTAVAGKLQNFQTLLGALIQKKHALRQSALNSIQLSTIPIQPGFVFRKHVYVSVQKPVAPSAPAAPDSTTSIDLDATTTSK